MHASVRSLLGETHFTRLPDGSAIADGVSVSEDVFIGNGVTLYPGVDLGGRCIVLDGAVIGRIPISNGTTTRPIRSEYGRVVVGDGTIVGANSVIYTGTSIGTDVLIGDLASIREGCRLADRVILGRGVMVLSNCTVGPFSRIQDQAHLVGEMTIEEHVFIGMGVVTTNDNDVYLRRFGIAVGGEARGPIIRRLAVIGAGATLLPGVEIGEGAQVGAGAVITRSVEPWTVMTGVPARPTRTIPSAWREAVIEGARATERGDLAPDGALASMVLAGERRP